MAVLAAGSAVRAGRLVAVVVGAFCSGLPACGGGPGKTTNSDGAADQAGDHRPANVEGTGGGSATGGSGGAGDDRDAAMMAEVSSPLEVAPPVDAAADSHADAPTTGTGPLTVEGLQVAGTHNSYHVAPLIAFDASHAYTHKPLDQQLDGGVRALELDVHLASDGTFDVYHITTIDSGSTCKKLENCLNIVATWSSAHPRHVPIFIWLEIKDDTGGMPINDIVSVETVVLRALARDRLITPTWLRGTFASPHERIVKAGWPTVDEARGKIMLALIDRDARSKAYSHDGTSLEDRAMWVNAATTEFGQPWAVITKDIEQPTDIAAAHAAHLLLGVNTCTINLTDDACSARLGQFVQAGIHTLDDDLPFQISGRTYWLKLPNGSPGCNPVTAPANCRDTKLE